jgi:hypothetical protein
MAPNGFKRLAEQFDALAENLERCTAPAHRSKLLKRMRIVIDEIDQLLMHEHSYSDSERDSTAPPISP